MEEQCHASSGVTLNGKSRHASQQNVQACLREAQEGVCLRKPGRTGSRWKAAQKRATRWKVHLRLSDRRKAPPETATGPPTDIRSRGAVSGATTEKAPGPRSRPGRLQKKEKQIGASPTVNYSAAMQAAQLAAQLAYELSRASLAPADRLILDLLYLHLIRFRLGYRYTKRDTLVVTAAQLVAQLAALKRLGL